MRISSVVTICSGAKPIFNSCSEQVRYSDGPPHSTATLLSDTFSGNVSMNGAV